jgi:carbon storage regulator
MLVLTRSNQKRVVIGHLGEVVIHVLSIKGNYVRLGFEAPKTIPIHREEIYLQKQEEQVAIQSSVQESADRLSHVSATSTSISCLSSTASTVTQVVDVLVSEGENEKESI